ncbi:hypothetical protein COK10_10695 [Bacillus anthracis]|nr:hypothetical protein COK10_10695 [Bacillus anthracis]
MNKELLLTTQQKEFVGEVDVKHILSVKDAPYNAVGKNGVDDTKAIQVALNDAGALGTNTVYIPKGNYKITSPLEVREGTKIIMDNEAVIERHHNTWAMLNGKYGGTYKKYEAPGNIEIIGGIIDMMNADRKQTGNAIGFGHAKNIRVNGMTIKGVHNSHGFDLCGVKDVVIENCTFEDFTSDASHTYAEAVQLDAQMAGSFPGYDKESADGTHSVNITIRNNTFRNVQRAFGAHSSAHNLWYNNIKFIGNNVEGTKNWAVSLIKVSGLEIKDNTFTRCYGGVRIMNSSGNDTIEITTGKETGIHQGSSNIRITANNFNQVTDEHAVQLYSADDSATFDKSFICNNIIMDVSSVGRRGIDCKRLQNSKVIDNILSKINGNGIHLESKVACVDVQNNFLRDIFGSGIVVTKGFANMAINNNTLYSIGETGIVVYSDGVNISCISNLVKDAGMNEPNRFYGLAMFTRVANSTVQGNSIHKSEDKEKMLKYGIYVSSTTNEISSGGNHCSGIAVTQDNFFNPNSKLQLV